MPTEELRTTSEIMDALGGTAKVAELTGRTYQAAWNWRAIGTFPSNTYLDITTALSDAGYRAPPALWRMPAPATETAA